MLADFMDIEAVFANALLDYFVIENREIVFAREAFGTTDETGATVQKISNIAALWIARVLVGENHVSRRDVVILVICHNLADIIVKDYLVAVTRSGSVD